MPTPIPSYQPFEWTKINHIPIQEDKSTLCIVQPQPRLRLSPAYFQAGIPNALATIWLRASLIKQLHIALNYLPDEYGLEILDGWRPLSVQAALRERFRQDIVNQHPDYHETQIQTMLNQFVAAPYRTNATPPHYTGGSVDLTLFSLATQQTLDMGSAFDEPSPQSYTAALEDNIHHPAHHYRRLLYHAMIQAGFTNLPSEWWHFDYGNQNWAFFSQQPYAYFGAIEP